MPNFYIEAIDHARVYDVAVETPLELAPKLSGRLHNEILIKREDLQPVFSFKCRGAYNKIAHLSEEEKQRGIICASAGNHAQGVALAAKKLGIKATIVMPKTTPDIKIKAVESHKAEVILHGDSYSDAGVHAQQLRAESGMTYIHPYDDPLVIAGQGTIASELLRQAPGDLDYVFVPIGGGGLIAGIATYLKSISPDIRIIGVEPVDSAAMHDSVKAGERVILDQVGIFADGVAVKQVGEFTFELVKQYVDDIILVDTDELCAAIKDIYDENRTIVEPAGALSIAGIKKYVRQHQIRGKLIAAINSGANMNFDRLRHVAERSEMGEKREALFAVTIPEKPGSFLSFCQLLGQRAITEFNYRLSTRDIAHVFVGIGTKSVEDYSQIEALLTQHGYPVTNLNDNELAKLHVRHMVGGKSPLVTSEQLYRFEFPERPGALLDFLSKLAGRWNISLFHYRNHGADFGRVLVGIEVSEQDQQMFNEYLKQLGFAYVNETENPAYHQFLN
ncbi:MAG: threonine ammonia-lyase, biosynthetic [Zetaproteobacteria bacterium CG_4_9_14_3_um_filter_49_83]|nr:MAG: PLP-dependent threonine dehydratase [Zetaproteobacteria bacterium CG1_02_49_23]PIQ30564.1 MAG: threonine ammonia-lyase, biosynthetic [Zetaproteobacteria bacterium CG17_big_fil_post_rev_8_21_14_2_50_50_13]PIV31327.1 MAG: threonine ammonia-lyase, biosynthetic [Zetaproteobacteria bacterium CG02_land_8_20_14_3_00_50_9]PIY55136.1 MAG: threonine ammonia-lyase, biosynthetic [Zetaproteobacteria bacterium CG_4_10_14_0_8_um_filter_49_80]PJA35781.1 MAG: threonine ammonia-lyase, biosynthetic [Zetap